MKLLAEYFKQLSSLLASDFWNRLARSPPKWISDETSSKVVSKLWQSHSSLLLLAVDSSSAFSIYSDIDVVEYGTQWWNKPQNLSIFGILLAEPSEISSCMLCLSYKSLQPCMGFLFIVLLIYCSCPSNGTFCYTID